MLSALSFLTAVLLANLNLSILVSPEAWDDMHVKHTWHAVPVDWESLGHPSAGTTIDLYIALEPERESALIDALSEVSNPRHPRYGKHLFKEEVADLVRPTSDTLELVRAWLAYHSIRPSSISTTHGGAWLTVTDVLVLQANRLLDASYQLFRNTKTNETIIRTVGYALPAVLHALIQDVAPTTYFASGRVMQQTPLRRTFGPTSAQAAPRNLMTARASRPGINPPYLRWLYGTNAYVAAATSRNKLGIVGFHGEFPSQTDLNWFTNHYDRYAAGAAFTVVPVSGAANGPNNPIEMTNANVQYAATMGYPTPLTFYSVLGSGDPYLQFLDYLTGQTDIPQTMSISNLGLEQNLPPGHAMALCNMFAQLGTRGVSVLIASGVHGVGAGHCERFVPEFPASCPWVTTVGGATRVNPEFAAGFSGGGFSTYFRRPDYQVNAVPGYLDHLEGEYEGLFNHFARGYPDISAQAFDLTVILNNHVGESGGTNLAASTVAGIVSLLNDFLISKRKAPLGFLNPWLYEDGLKGLTDVLEGSNPGCDTNGFPAAAGWDPVTGLGTPEFKDLLSLLTEQLKNRPAETPLPLPTTSIG